MGIIECRIDNIFCLFYLLVPARIASFSERVFLAKGSSMTLNCLSVGVPPGSNVWNFRGEKLDKNKNRFQLLSNGSVLLSEISDEHTGNYTCRVENRHGSDEINYQVQIKGKRVVNLKLSTYAKTHIF